jgi:hypothetical protein
MINSTTGFVDFVHHPEFQIHRKHKVSELGVRHLLCWVPSKDLTSTIRPTFFLLSYTKLTPLHNPEYRSFQFMTVHKLSFKEAIIPTLINSLKSGPKFVFSFFITK